MCATLALNTYWTWSVLPYFPIEYSQMGWGKPGAMGGYYIMAIGTNIAATIMFRVHVLEGSYVGAFCAVFLALLGLINGDDTPVVQMLHGIVAFICFVLGIVYVARHSIPSAVWRMKPQHVVTEILYDGGPATWVAVAFIALIVGHLIVATQLKLAEVIEIGLWPAWTKAQTRHSVGLLIFKAILQNTMLVALFAGYFSVMRNKHKAA